jgi:uncharacterized membrane protein
MEPILDIVTTICIELMTGAEFAVSVFVNPILGQLDDTAEAHAMLLFARKLGVVMPFWYGLSLLVLLAETFMRRQQPGVALLGAASTGRAPGSSAQPDETIPSSVVAVAG